MLPELTIVVPCPVCDIADVEVTVVKGDYPERPNDWTISGFASDCDCGDEDVEQYEELLLERLDDRSWESSGEPDADAWREQQDMRDALL